MMKKSALLAAAALLFLGACANPTGEGGPSIQVVGLNSDGSRATGALPNLTISNLVADNLFRNDFIEVSFSIKNTGPVDAAKSKIYYKGVLSKSPTLGHLTDVFVWDHQMALSGTLSHGKSQTVRDKIPGNLFNGSRDWYLIVGIDSRNNFTESNENDNQAFCPAPAPTPTPASTPTPPPHLP